MADRTLRIGPQTLTTTASTIYTVPTGDLTTLRYLHVTNLTGSEQTWTLSIGTDAAGTRIFDQSPIPARGVITLPFNIPMTAGEILQAFAGANSSVNITISHFEEDLP